MVRRHLDLLVRSVVGQTRHPGEHDCEGILVELLATTELLLRRTADPTDRAVARERARHIGRPVSIGLGADVLVIPQELRHAQRLRGIARGDQTRCLLVQVAAPHPVVAVVEIIPIREVAPGRCEPCDTGAAKRLVLGGVQGHRANVVGASTQGVARYAGGRCAKPIHISVPAAAVWRDAAVGGLAIGEACG